MATTPIEVYYDPGKTLTASVYPRNSDTASFTGRSLTEESNRTGVYKCNITEALDGKYTVHLFEGTRKRAIFDIDLDDNTNTHYCMQVGSNVIASFYDSIVFLLATIGNNVSSTLADTNELQTDWKNGGRLDLIVDAIKSKTDQLAFTTANQVNARVFTNSDKTGYSISGSKTTLDDLNDVSTAQVNTEVDTALADYDGPTNAEMTSAFTEIKGATWSTTDTLEAIRDRGDAAWTTADVSGLATSAALATVDGNVDSILEDTGTTLPATLSTILADTNELQTNQGDWATADVSGLATASALATVGSNVNGIVSITADIDSAVSSMLVSVNEILTDTGTTIPATLSTILADTNELQTNQGDWTTADVSGLATAAALATVDANVDSILVDTGTSIPATLTTILADTNELQTNQGNWTTADVSGLATAAALATVDSNVDAILVDTGTTIPDQISGLNNLSAAEVNAQVDIALSDYDGPTQSEMAAAFTEIKGATWSTTDTLEQIRDNVGGGGGGGDATEAKQDTIIAAIGALNDISAADVIDYDMGNGRTVAEALAPLRNKWTIASGVYTVYDTDDTTVLWTASSVQTAGDPTSSIDPA